MSCCAKCSENPGAYIVEKRKKEFEKKGYTVVMVPPTRHTLGFFYTIGLTKLTNSAELFMVGDKETEQNLMNGEVFKEIVSTLVRHATTQPIAAGIAKKGIKDIDDRRKYMPVRLVEIDDSSRTRLMVQVAEHYGKDEKFAALRVDFSCGNDKFEPEEKAHADFVDFVKKFKSETEK